VGGAPIRARNIRAYPLILKDEDRWTLRLDTISLSIEFSCLVDGIYAPGWYLCDGTPFYLSLGDHILNAA
jgi:hypothetical protein